MEIKLFSPQKDGTLGWVNHTYNPNNYWALFGNFFIGTGPVWLGLAALYGITWCLLPVERFDMQGLPFQDAICGFLEEVIFHEESLGLGWFIWLYLAFAIGAHTTLSIPDIEGAIFGFLVIATGILIACLVSGWICEWPVKAANAIGQFTGYFLSPVLTILGVIGFVSFIFWFIASLLTMKKRKRRRR